MQKLATEIGDALSEVFGGRERIGPVRVVDAQEAVCRVLDRWEIPGSLVPPENDGQGWATGNADPRRDVPVTPPSERSQT